MEEIGISNQLWRLTRNRYARFMFYILDRVGIKFSKVIVYTINLENHALSTRKTSAISIEICTKKELEKLTYKKNIREFKKDMEDGHLMFGAFLEDKMAGYLWLSFQKVYVSEIEQYKNFDGACIWRSYTTPDFRQKGIAKQLVIKTLEIVKERYKGEKAYAIVETDNIPSQKVFESNGFKPQKIISFVKFLKTKRYKEQSLNGRN